MYVNETEHRMQLCTKRINLQAQDLVYSSQFQANTLTLRKSARCLSTPTRTSSRSLRKPSKTGTRSICVISSPTITASSWREKASVRRTFHWSNTRYTCHTVLSISAIQSKEIERTLIIILNLSINLNQFKRFGNIFIIKQLAKKHFKESNKLFLLV